MWCALSPSEALVNSWGSVATSSCCAMSSPRMLGGEEEVGSQLQGLLYAWERFSGLLSRASGGMCHTHLSSHYPVGHKSPRNVPWSVLDSSRWSQL